MLDMGLNQAAGLQALGLQSLPRLVSVASHGDQRLELPLLWALCRTWVDQGQAVLVLDGHSAESAHNPGLQQALDHGGLGLDEDADAGIWQIMPAAHGLSALGTPDFEAYGDPLRCLAERFGSYGVVLVYAPVRTLLPLLKGSGAKPLLVVPPLHASALTAYRALKQLLVEGQLQPSVANIALPHPTSTAMTLPEPIQQLQACARTFLGYAVRPVRLTASTAAQEELTVLALQLLENAVLLQRHPLRSLH
ncbi:MAG: hypothetical protein Fur007_20260 [Rhodoferax sp.]